MILEKEHKIILVRLAAAAALFAVGIFAPLEGLMKLTVYIPAYLICAYDVLWESLCLIRSGKVFDENFLMSVASIGAFFAGEYPEAVLVMALYQVGEMFEDMAVEKSRRSISDLMEIKPEHAVVVRGGAELTVAPEDVVPGETIVIRPGERVPLDGVITEGSTTLNTAALTGESAPRDCAEGDNVISGCINITAPVYVRVTSVYGESTAARVLSLVENAAERKAKTENFITVFSRWYTPCVVAAAVLLAVVPPLFFRQVWSVWLSRALIFLVVSCPCALVISVPLTFFAGIGGASRRGILVKGSNYLEALSRVKTVAFDKTGTLTLGSFSVSAVHPQNMSRAELLDIAALAESYSNHPIAASIVRAHGGHIDKSRIDTVEELSGKGMRAVIDGKLVCAGNGRLMADAGADWHECSQNAGTVIHISCDGSYCGHIVISDEPKPDSAKAVGDLKEIGVVRTVMLTGDAKRVADSVAKELGIAEAYSELLPDGKTELTERLLREKHEKTTLAFVGDGINDAPVLALADVGIAMGALGSDAAVEAADVILMNDNPVLVPKAIRIARRTMRIVKENIIFALSVKGAVLILGALGQANMWIAVFADVGVTLIAVANAMRALRQ